MNTLFQGQTRIAGLARKIVIDSNLHSVRLSRCKAFYWRETVDIGFTAEK